MSRNKLSRKSAGKQLINYQKRNYLSHLFIPVYILFVLLYQHRVTFIIYFLSSQSSVHIGLSFRVNY